MPNDIMDPMIGMAGPVIEAQRGIAQNQLRPWDLAQARGSGGVNVQGATPGGYSSGGFVPPATGGGFMPPPRTGGPLMAPQAPMTPGGPQMPGPMSRGFVPPPKPDMGAQKIEDKRRAQQRALSMMGTPGPTVGPR